MMLVRCLALSIVMIVLLVAPAQAGDGAFAVVAGRTLMPDGTLVDGKAVVVQGGKITRVIDADDLDSGMTVVRYDDAVLSPGLIDVASSLGVSRGDVERTDPIDPALSIVDALDARSPDMHAALAAGVTAAMIAPEPTNVVGGATAVVKTSGAVIVDDGPVLMTLGPSVFRRSAEPSSRAGALHMLRQALRQADDARLEAVVAGKSGVVAACASAQDVSAILRVLGTYEVVPVIVHSADAVDVAAELGEYDAAAVLGPYGLSSSRRLLAGPAAMEDAGVTIAFRSGAPGAEPANLRLTAALAVRSGLSPEAARRGLTANAAQIAGLADRLGAIATGHDADLVIFSGDPLRLDARVLEVFLDGKRVHAAPSPPLRTARGEGVR